ncbi:MAG: DUF58 domain-containing protein [Acutalibacteraceae bacterium]
MLKNILIYLFILAAVFVFSVVYYAWFSWFLLIAVICIPLVSLAVSLPFMVHTAVNGLKCFCDETAENFQSVNIGVRSKGKKAVICPYLKVKFKTENEFAARRKTVVMKYGGRVGSGVSVSCTDLTKHCGCVNISARYARVYDFTGIFFLPVKLNFSESILVMPLAERPELQPDSQSTAVLGFKPKPGGGFSDYYELRPYRSGDSLKSVHWKLSSKLDELIVKEPSEAVYRKLVVKPEITDKPDENDYILARFLYASLKLCESGAEFYALDCRSGAVMKIKGESDVSRFLAALYNKSLSIAETSLDGAVFYNILPHGEEVSEP